MASVDTTAMAKREKSQNVYEKRDPNQEFVW
jgi:hypothetical protein